MGENDRDYTAAADEAEANDFEEGDGAQAEVSAADAPEPATKYEKTKMEIFDWLQCVVMAVIAAIFIFVFLGRTIGVDGSSMLQTLHDRDRVVMTSLYYTPKYGDIIIFQSPTGNFGETPLVKRVIAVEGQVVDINFDTGEVFVDGRLLDEPYINERTINRADFIGPLTVKEGHVFVMGDNRNRSSDSRDNRVGQVDTRYILGKVLFLLVPGGDEDNPRDWRRAGFVRGS
ncbi:MAG: signal peptidase I [Oscillospiraceae bacterium]|nr:signal peptidase I [Oscillospiraceae bacterium]